jgi:hypothetical protein
MTSGSHTTLTWRSYFILAFELALLLLVIHQFRIEADRNFLPLAIVVFSGFAIHTLLPLRYRLSFFLLLSLGGIFYVMGFAHGAWLIGMSLGLIALCHLPLAYWLRITLVILAAALLVALRAPLWPNSLPVAIWPVLGSMFMFRLISYLYERRDENPPAPWTQRLSYFLLLPNISFPFFPIVNYQTFRDTYFNESAERIYQTGIHWMWRGIVQLLLYRLVYYRLALPIAEVQDIGSLAQFLVAGYLLAMRLSGQFHLIIGMLHLFGFNLPEVMQKYFLATSFTDLWRRINLPWRTFITKLIYNPLFMQWRRIGFTWALALATAIAFVFTWFFHNYQYFWLRGNFPLTWQDAGFWSFFGILVTANALYEARRKNKAGLKQKSRTASQALQLSLRTVGMFLMMAVLWSFWTSPSLEEWFSLWNLSASNRWQGLEWIAIVLVSALIVLTGYYRIERCAWFGRLNITTWTFGKSAMWSIASLVAIFSLAHLSVKFAPESKLTEVAASLQQTSLNRIEQARLVKGYYEDLLAVNHLHSPLAEMSLAPPADWLGKAPTTGAYTDKLLLWEVAPSVTQHFKGATVQTNRWGMRDRDYRKEKPAGVYRLAVLGASDAMGSGVNNDEVFEAILETRLNQEQAGKTPAQYEVLNFAGPGYSPIQQLIMLEKKALAFAPDAVLYVAHAGNSDAEFAVDYFYKVLSTGSPIRCGYMRELIAKTRLTKTMTQEQMRKRLQPHANDIMAWVYREIVALCRKYQIVPVWVALPQLSELFLYRLLDERHLQQARAAGFITISLTNLYRQHPQKLLWIAPWDIHPNAKAHRFIAERLYLELMQLGLTNWPILTYQPDLNGSNGDHDHHRHWHLFLEKSSQANLEFLCDDKEGMRLTITKVGTAEPWAIQLNQSGHAVHANRRYTVQFKAHADQPRRLALGFSKAHPPWDGLGLYRQFDLTSEWQNFTAEFVATGDDDNARIHFDAGGSAIFLSSRR